MNWVGAMKFVVAFAVLFLLVGCSPGVVGFIGLERTGETFRAVVTMCEGYSLAGVELRDRSLVDDYSEFAVTDVWSLADAQSGIAVATIPESSEFPGALGSGKFMLWGTVGGGFPAVASGPIFAVDDLDALGAGEILTVAPYAMENIVYTSSAQMLSAAAEYCND